MWRGPKIWRSGFGVVSWRLGQLIGLAIVVFGAPFPFDLLAVAMWQIDRALPRAWYRAGGRGAWVFRGLVRALLAACIGAGAFRYAGDGSGAAALGWVASPLAFASVVSMLVGARAILLKRAFSTWAVDVPLVLFGMLSWGTVAALRPQLSVTPRGDLPVDGTIVAIFVLFVATATLGNAWQRLRVRDVELYFRAAPEPEWRALAMLRHGAEVHGKQGFVSRVDEVRAARQAMIDESFVPLEVAMERDLTLAAPLLTELMSSYPYEREQAA